MKRNLQFTSPLPLLEAQSPAKRAALECKELVPPVLDNDNTSSMYGPNVLTTPECSELVIECIFHALQTRTRSICDWIW